MSNKELKEFVSQLTADQEHDILKNIVKLYNHRNDDFRTLNQNMIDGLTCLQENMFLCLSILRPDIIPDPKEQPEHFVWDETRIPPYLKQEEIDALRHMLQHFTPQPDQEKPE